MKKVSVVKIQIGGKEYPCRMTLGAMRRFKRETGKDVSAITEADIDDMITLMWCCAVSSCNADKTPFDMTLDDFADSLDSGDMGQFIAAATNPDGADDEQKKS